MTFAAAVAAADRAAAWWVAAQPGDPDPTSGHPAEWGKAAPAGLLIWLFMGAALFFLIKSMNRHMRRVPASFDDAAVAAPEGLVEDEPDGDAVAERGGGDEGVEELVVAEGQRPAARTTGGVEDRAGRVEDAADQQ